MTDEQIYLEERKKLLKKPKSEFFEFCLDTKRRRFFNKYGTEYHNWELFNKGYRTLKDIEESNIIIKKTLY